MQLSEMGRHGPGCQLHPAVWTWYAPPQMIPLYGPLSWDPTTEILLWHPCSNRPQISGHSIGNSYIGHLMHVFTTTPVPNTNRVDLMVSPLYYPSKPQSSPQWTLLYRVYPPPEKILLILSGCVPHSSCDVVSVSDSLSRKSSIINHPTSTVA